MIVLWGDGYAKMDTHDPDPIHVSFVRFHFRSGGLTPGDRGLAFWLTNRNPSIHEIADGSLCWHVTAPCNLAEFSVKKNLTVFNNNDQQFPNSLDLYWAGLAVQTTWSTICFRHSIHKLLGLLTENVCMFTRK